VVPLTMTKLLANTEDVILRSSVQWQMNWYASDAGIPSRHMASYAGNEVVTLNGILEENGAAVAR
jgi:hypothetical protein